MKRTALVLGVSVLAAWIGAACYLSAGRATAAADQDEDIEEVLGRLEDVSKAFVAVSRKVKPSVVHVSARRTHRTRAGWFFGPRQYESTGTGSGVIVDADGVIVTNNHVVTGAAKLTVKLADGRELPAQVLGGDPRSDIAVLKVEEEGLPACALGDSDALEVGQWVLAIGNPFGLEQTVTAGIVSAKGRANLNLLDYEDFIQTDAAINPGNSGGPLVNLKGEVVGINAVIISRTGGYQGIGFAIPIRMARRVVDSILSEGKVSRGYLGVSVGDVGLRPEAARSAGVDDPRAVRVSEVVEGGPAETAGLKEGDLILRIGDRRVTNRVALRTVIGQLPPGSEVEVEAIRDGRRKTLTVVLGDLDRSAAPLGIKVRDLTPAIAKGLGYTPYSGVLVEEVQRGTEAYRKGLERGDLILSVDGEKVSNLDDLEDALDAAGTRLTLEIRRGDLTGEVEMERYERRP